MYGIFTNIQQVEVLLSQFEWNSRDSPTETWLTDRYRSTDSLSFVTPANFPRAVTVRRMANDATYTMYVALPIHLCVQSMHTHTHTHTHHLPIHLLLCSKMTKDLGQIQTHSYTNTHTNTHSLASMRLYSTLATRGRSAATVSSSPTHTYTPA